MSNNNSVVSSNWPGFHRLWVVVAIILLILLLLLWLLGYGPGGSKCEVPPTIVEKKVDVEKIVDNPKLLTKIGILSEKIGTLEKENSVIPGLKEKIEGLATENAKIDGLNVKIGALEGENEKISDLTEKIKELEVEKSKVSDLTSKISKLEKDNIQIVALQEEIAKLEKSNQEIAGLRRKIEELKNRKPTVIERIIKVPVAPAIPSAPAKVMGTKLPAVAKLYFDVGSSDFPADVNLSLSSVIAYLKNNSESKAIISGFHDASGSFEANKALSLKRAESVLKLLVEAGVPVDRMKIEKPQQTYGSGSPEEARRVEVSIVK